MGEGGEEFGAEETVGVGDYTDEGGGRGYWLFHQVQGPGWKLLACVGGRGPPTALRFARDDGENEQQPIWLWYGCCPWELVEGLFDGGDDLGVVGWGVGGEAGEDGAVAGDEEFLKVPKQLGEGVGWWKAVLACVVGEVFAPGAVGDVLGCGGDEGGVERVLGGAGDGDLGEEGEGYGVLGGAEFGDLLVGAGLLAGEVVGGEAENGEAAVFVLLVEGFEGGVLRGEAAFAGDVHDEEDVAGVVG